MTGCYVAFEGIEGAGKTTLASLVVRRLHDEGRDVRLVREPGGTAGGEAIRAVVLDPAGSLEPWAEALLFAAARSQLAAEVIGPALAEGALVIGDRSVYSSLAYQGGGRGLGVAAVRSVNEAGLGGVWPDLVVLLSVDPEHGLARQAVEDRIGAEGAAFQARVAATFDDMAAAEPGRFVSLDAARPVDDLVAEAAALILERC